MEDLPDLPFHLDRLKESFLCAAALHGMQDDCRCAMQHQDNGDTLGRVMTQMRPGLAGP